ncbi:peptidylprolyl isomerase [uncultured Roseobacter sp.]|uniref:peptidylprolyl isomerase n=1 Tax=uncultured Roseobacter sp. TaxID=114847 RepID=UPI002635EADC|nr:peptidylprolyl isomerase [uncultured Roseobacter sp.]
MAAGKSISKTAMWILMGLLFLGLAGFGATNLSGNIRSIGTVGDKTLPVESYYRSLQQEIQAFQQQSGQVLPFARAQEIGIDRAVLQRLVANRALDHEATEMGISIGDANLRDRILSIGAFRGLDGGFDREAYRFALQQNGVTESQFEEQLREEVSRTLLQGAVLSGIDMPATYVDTLMTYVAARASFAWTSLDADDLETPLETPSDAVLRAHYDENIADFTLPETRQITYAVLTPDMLIDEVEIEEAVLREQYEARAAEFNQPERRLVERLAYLDEAAASAALASLGEDTGFGDLVEERGLTLQDVDLGDVSLAELGEAGEAVFAASVGDVVGPLPSPLGAALFRVNGVLPAQETSFEDAQEILRPALVNDRAQRLVDAQAQNLDDMLAGGATLEELDSDTDMVLGSIDWSASTDEDVAAYEAFRREAARVTAEDFPAIERLDDGGLFALRLDNVLPPRPEPFDEARDAVLAHWQAAETANRLAEQVAGIVPQLETGTSFADLGYDVVVEENLVRSDFVGGTPADFMDTVFEMDTGEVRVIEAPGSVIVVRMIGTAPPEESEDNTRLREQLEQQAGGALAQDLFDIFNADVTRRAEPQINPQALQAVHVNFP